MAITRLDFRPIAQGGDNPTAAFVKLDANDADLDTRISAAMPLSGGQFAGDVTFAAGKKLTVAGLITGSGGFSGTTMNLSGALTASGLITAASGSFQIGASTGRFTTMDYSGTVTNSVTTNPGTTGFNSLVWRVAGNFGGGFGIKDGTSNIGWWSNSGNLIFGFGTNDGVMTEQARVTAGGLCQFKGYQCRSGSSGSYGGNVFNFNWTNSSLAVYVDSSNIGNVQISASDYRIKDPDSIRPTDGLDLEVVMQWEPVTWRYADVGVWRDDGREHRSFIAHVLAESDPTLVIGEKDAVDDDGEIVPQQLDVMAIASRLAGAVQTLARQNAALAARVEQLEKANG